MKTPDLSSADACSCPNAGKHAVGNSNTPQNQCDLIMINLRFVFSFLALDQRRLRNPQPTQKHAVLR
jgi:hypothetical protein